MKLFINDWHGNMDDFDMNTFETREYPLNTWITATDKKSVFLVSAYVYNDFVMFFYMYDLSYHPGHEEQETFIMPTTQRESLEMSKKHRNRFSIHFEYEVNHLKSASGRGGECLPSLISDISPESEQDEFTKMHLGEYDYLNNLMKETGRIPDELKDKNLAFKKDCFSFEEPVNEINHIAVYLSTHESHTYSTDKTFTVPYGVCDIKVPYTLSDTGDESYIVIKELKIQNMLADFEEHYDEFKNAHEKTLQEYEKNKEKYGDSYSVIGLDEIRRHYDKTILTLSFLKPEEKRSFEFYTADYLDSKVIKSTFGIVFISTVGDEKMEGELYRCISNLNDASSTPKDEYEITLMSVTDPLRNEREAVFELEY